MAFPLLTHKGVRRGAARASLRVSHIRTIQLALPTPGLSLFSCEREREPLYSASLEQYSDFGSYPRHTSESADSQRKAGVERAYHFIPKKVLPNSNPRWRSRGDFMQGARSRNGEIRGMFLSQCDSHLGSDNYQISRLWKSDRLQHGVRTGTRDRIAQKDRSRQGNSFA